MRVTTRFSLERFLVLDRAVRAGEFPNAGTLSEILEVSRRTIQRNIEFLRDRMNVPLEFDPQRNGYFYRDATYRLPALLLTEGELIALFLGERVLRQYRGTPYAPDLARAFRKLVAGLTDPVTLDLADLGDSISFRSSVEAPFDHALFRELAGAIRSRRRVALAYWSASRDCRPGLRPAACNPP